VYPEPDQAVLFQAQGVVVRHAAEGAPRGMGVDFVELGGTARDVLHKIMLRAEADRQDRRIVTTDETLRTHGLVAQLLGEPAEDS